MNYTRKTQKRRETIVEGQGGGENPCKKCSGCTHQSSDPAVSIPLVDYERNQQP
ncbi:hypothetical protein FA13DRAFT_1737457, partial [Coprinellus micaceus]